MNRKKILLVTGCWLLVTFLCGCATIPGTTSYKEKQGEVSLDVAALLRFKDVPVPYGFKILDAESFAFQNDETRVALLKYIGSRQADTVVAFYKEQMPMYNWSPINIIEYDRRILNYEKGDESCIITIEGRGGKSVITVALSPKSRPMKVEKKEK